MTGQSESAPQFQINWRGRTVVGKVRTNNEDTLAAGPVTDEVKPGDSDGDASLQWAGVLLAVADGMGGALAGEVASGLAVTTLADELRTRTGNDGEGRSAEQHRQTLIHSVETANQKIRGEGDNNPQHRGMGTTLTAVWLHDGVAEIAQVGDSRAYRFRGGHLQQLTKDQSLVGKLIEDGIITEEEAERIAGRNIILQALGSEEELDVVHQCEPLKPGELLMLCTDGLSGVVNNTEIEEELRKGGSLDELISRLIDMAEARGGPDNITILMGRVEDD